MGKLTDTFTGIAKNNGYATATHTTLHNALAYRLNHALEVGSNHRRDFANRA